VKAQAHLRVDCNQSGKTVVSSLRSDGPLQLRQSGESVYMVGGSAAPLGGDDLRLSIIVGRGTTLNISSVAAMLAQPGASGLQSRFTTTIVVEPKATLNWTPLPTISVKGSNHINDVSIKLASDKGQALLHHTNRFGDDSAGWAWHAKRPISRVTTKVCTPIQDKAASADHPVEIGDFSQASMAINGLQVLVGIYREQEELYVRSGLREQQVDLPPLAEDTDRPRLGHHADKT